MDLPFADEALELDPIDIVEAVVGSDARFVSERCEDGDLTFSTRGDWCDVVGFFSFREELPAVLLTVTFDLRAPKDRWDEAARLAALVNQNLWLGHFDLWADDGAIVFRHALPMIGRGELAAGEVQALLAASMEAADRFYPAFDFLINAGQTAEACMESALFDTIGEA